MPKNNRLPFFAVALVILLLVVLGVVIWKKSVTSVSNSGASTPVHTVKKIDLASQPLWVQKLVVTAASGRSANGLKNVTLKVTGLPSAQVDSVTYTFQYETSNKGTQGTYSSKPLEVAGAENFSKTFDLGTCSTKSCVTHDGVKAIDVELDFNTSSGDQPVWTGTVQI